MSPLVFRSISAALLMLAQAASKPARAQSVATTVRPNADALAVTNGDKFPEESIFGDWRGVRPTLADLGIDLGLSYLSETAGVVSGGMRQGVDYAHSITFQADMDWSKLAGLQGFSTHLAMVERAGRNASSDYVGDHLSDVQEIYGGANDMAAHLVYLYGEERLVGGKIDIEAGRLDVGQDFAASPLYCEFMSLSVCPSPRSLSLESGFTIFPSSNWGSRIRLQPVTAAYVQLGVYQRRPEGGGRAGLDWSTSDTTGAILPMELGFEPNFGQQHLIGHYKLGAIYDTSDHADLGDGQLVPTTRSRHGDPSLYILLDQMIMRTGPNGTDGVILLAGYTHADAHVAQVEQLAFAGVLASGIIPARPADSIGFQFTWLKVSNALISTQELQADFGEPLSPGLSTLATPPGIQGHEANLEARYDIHLASGIHLMPDIQYVIHPDATSRYHNATILGLRTTLEFY